jgi:hypothetical protein
MGVPVPLEFFTILLNVIEEEGMQKPDVVWVIPLKEVESFKAGEKGPPATGKMSPSLKPEPLNPGVMCRPVGCESIEACDT